MKRNSWRKIGSFVSFGLLISIGCYAQDISKEPYKPKYISDVSTKVEDKGFLVLEDRRVEYTVSYETMGGEIPPSVYHPHNSDYITSLMKESWPLMQRLLSERRIPSADCRDNYNLNIFVLRNNTLQNWDRFPDFINGKTNFGNQVLYGYYDSTLEIEKNSAILVTDMGSILNEEVFVHELGHYWWDRLCVKSYTSIDSEIFATSFQEAYKRRKR
jgi:hypothetical protein